MTNEEILKRTWELMPDDITANDFAYTNSIEIRIKEAIALARADERAKVMEEMGFTFMEAGKLPKAGEINIGAAGFTDLTPKHKTELAPPSNTTIN